MLRLTLRLGAYHAPLHTFLDFSFLRTLPVGQVSRREGRAHVRFETDSPS